MRRLLLATAVLAAAALPASAQDKIRLGIIAYQMSAETHARAANAAEAAAKARGWDVTLLNSRGSTPEHASQLETLVTRGVTGIVMAMGKTNELDAQLASAKAKGISVVTIMSGTSPNTLFDITVDDFQAGAQISSYLLGRMNYRGEILVQRYEGHGGTRARAKVLDAILSENSAVKVLDTSVMARPQGWREDVKQSMETLTLKHRGKFQGIWASFDGQGFVIDDILQAQGLKKGQVLLVGTDGGQETFRRIRDPESLFTATVAIPFERMGTTAVEALERITVRKEPKEKVVAGPVMMLPAVLVDASNVPADGQWPW